jgi:cytochrome P450
VGYGLWIAPEAVDDNWWPALKRCFDVLDQERAFVNPQETLITIKTNKARERAAVDDIKQMIAAIIEQHDANPDKNYAAVDFLRERFADTPIADRARKIAHNLINANQGFLSNLYAAIAWVIVRLLQYPAVLATVNAEITRVRHEFGADFTRSIEALNSMDYLEQVMMESVRLAQSSITLRKVLQPVEFDDGAHRYTVQPGVYITTMLSVTNSQTEELARFDPEHYSKNQLSKTLAAVPKETVSTFGHGKHACPAQRFSHHMAKIVVVKMLERFALQAAFVDAQPSARQMGGVARPDEPTRMHFRRH